MRSTDVFIKDVRKIARANDITIKLPKTEFVYCEDDPIPSCGYFQSEGPLLVVGTGGKSIKSWVATLVHESCHMDQFIEDQFLWTKCAPGYEVFFDWLWDEDYVVKENVLYEAVQDIIRLELDCERRSIKKIREYNLPIDIPQYIRGANVYLYSYLYMLQVRKWVPAVYSCVDTAALASSKFSSSYTKIPRRLNTAFKSIYTDA